MVRLAYRLHARQQMAERGRYPAQVRAVVQADDVVEATQHEGRPFPSLLLRWAGNRPLHVLIADDPAGTQYVITVYVPSIERWDADIRRRKERP